MCVSQEESRKLLPIAEMGKKLSFGLVACSSLFLQVGDPPCISDSLGDGCSEGF
jgi:hypothetical protein